MELTVMGRQYRLEFKYKAVIAVRKYIYRQEKGELVVSKRKTRKQPLQFVDERTISGELGSEFLILDIRRCITAVIIPTDVKVAIITSGSAACSPKDNFSKARGRKIALARALKQFPKDFRTAFWEAYFGGTATFVKKQLKPQMNTKHSKGKTKE